MEDTCNQYIDCSSGVERLVTCQNHLVHDDATSDCEHPDAANREGCEDEELYGFNYPDTVSQARHATESREPDRCRKLSREVYLDRFEQACQAVQLASKVQSPHKDRPFQFVARTGNQMYEMAKDFALRCPSLEGGTAEAEIRDNSLCVRDDSLSGVGDDSVSSVGYDSLSGVRDDRAYVGDDSLLLASKIQSSQQNRRFQLATRTGVIGVNRSTVMSMVDRGEKGNDQVCHVWCWSKGNGK